LHATSNSTSKPSFPGSSHLPPHPWAPPHFFSFSFFSFLFSLFSFLLPHATAAVDAPGRPLPTPSLPAASGGGPATPTRSRCPPPPLRQPPPPRSGSRRRGSSSSPTAAAAAPPPIPASLRPPRLLLLSRPAPELLHGATPFKPPPRMEDPTSAPAARGGLPAPPTAATRLAGAVYHREQDWRLRIDTMDDTRAPSSTFPVSAPATRAISGGALPPRPSVAPSAKKKRAPVAKKLLLPAATRSRAPPPSCEPHPVTILRLELHPDDRQRR
ncbi:hypothetical protein EJB05_54960, partial [Eragrostis curvula]